MNKKVIFRSALAAILVVVSFSSVKAQLYYQDSHLFVGQRPINWQTVGNTPQVFIGPDFGIEFCENGLNFWRPNPVSNWGNYKLFLDASGKFGIGRKPTTYALEVNGQVWTTAGLLITSDGNLKRNIVNLSDSKGGYLDRLHKLSGKSYDKQISTSEDNAAEVARMVALGKLSEKDASVALASLNESNPTAYKKEFGFIAQEVKELFPELVEEGADGLMAINYVGLIPLLVESVKELNKKVAELEKRNSDMPTIRSSDATDNTSVSLPGATLYQNTPNPSSTGTTIKYELPENYSSAILYIYSMSGNQVKSYTLNRSSNQVIVAANELPAGTYIYTLSIDGLKIDTKRMILTN